MRNLRKTSYAITEDAKALLKESARVLGLTQTGTLEIVIRDYAKRNKIKLPVQPAKEQK